ncbi:MAG TPA: YckD family protein [Firmicutes bacterium]|nr:YckD family protein [Bacillota bacterium]
MKLRHLAVGLLVAASVAAVAVPVLAATTSSQDQINELLAIHKQIAELHKQMVDKLVAYGRITAQQGEEIKARIDARVKYLEDHPDMLQNCPWGLEKQGRARGCGQRSGCGLGLGKGL